MPLNIPKIPELSEEASKELPSAQQSVSSGKGSYLNWGLRIFMFSLVVLCGVIWYMWKSDKDNSQVQHEQDKTEIIYWRDKYVNLLEENRIKLDHIQDTTTILKNQILK